LCLFGSTLAGAEDVSIEGAMNRFNANIFTVICVFFSPLSGADEDTSFYIGVNVGPTSLNGQYLAQQNSDHLAANGYTYANTNISESEAGYKILFGYQFSRHIATELNYSYLGTFQMSGYTVGPSYNLTGSTRVIATGLDMVGMIPVNSEISGLVRLGYVHAKNESSVTLDGGGSTSWTDSKSGMKYGLGAEWEIARSLYLRIEGEYYFSDSNDQIKMISIGIR
jgi:hypothetical protein